METIQAIVYAHATLAAQMDSLFTMNIKSSDSHYFLTIVLVPVLQPFPCLGKVCATNISSKEQGILVWDFVELHIDC